MAATVAAAAGSQRDIALLKYADDGTLLWQQVIGGAGDDRPAAIAVDADGNVVLAGTTQSDTTGDDVLVAGEVAAIVATPALMDIALPVPPMLPGKSVSELSPPSVSAALPSVSAPVPPWPIAAPRIHGKSPSH